MDLILLQFGDPTFSKGGTVDKPEEIDDGIGGSVIDGAAFGDNWIGLNQENIDNKFNPDQCVELVSINQGIQQQVTTDVSNSARTSGRPQITDFTCVKYVDRTSPKMYDFCLRARPLDSDPKQPCIIYVLRNSGDRMNMIMKFELRATLISEIQFQSHPNDMSTEQFKLNFTEVTWVHQIQGSRMQNKGHTAAGWSVAKNRPIGKISA
jgi:type VI secretion system secreted protein Hcp